jgi:hypothetical protein
MAITKKSLISNSAASKSTSKSHAKTVNPAAAAKLATASRNVLAKPLATTSALKTSMRAGSALKTTMRAGSALKTTLRPASALKTTLRPTKATYAKLTTARILQ